MKIQLKRLRFPLPRPIRGLWVQIRPHAICGARHRWSSLPITCRRMLRMEDTPYSIEKYYPAFSIGLVMDPSSSEVVNSLRRKHNDPSLAIAQPFTHLRLYNQIRVGRYDYCKAYLEKLASHSSQFILKFGNPGTVDAKESKKTAVCLNLIQELACKTLLASLDKGFKEIVDEIKRRPLLLGGRTQFPEKPQFIQHWSAAPLGRARTLRVVIYRGPLETREKVLGELYDMPPNTFGSVKVIGLSLNFRARDETFHDPHFVQPYEIFYFQEVQRQSSTMKKQGSER
jgi:hypothetical protein